MEFEIRELSCKCGTILMIKSSIVRGFSDHEMVKCPFCKEDIDEIRADMGYEIINVIEPRRT